MYPDLSYILHAIIGSEPDNALAVIKTFGLLLMLAFITSAYVFKRELVRKEKQGLLKPRQESVFISRPSTWKDVAIQVLLGSFIGFKGIYAIEHFSQFKHDPAAIIFSGQGSWMGGLVCGLILGLYGYVYYLKHKSDETIIRTKDVWPNERVGEIVLLSALSGIAGAKLFSILENFQSFMNDPIGELFSGSGLTVYGGYLLAFIVVTKYIRSKSISMMPVIDSAAPAILMGYAVGRMGCHLSGDGDWGLTNSMPRPSWFVFPEWAWSFSYPHNVLNQGDFIPGCVWDYCYQLSPPVFPTPLWETTITLIIFVLLWSLRSKIVTSGIMFGLFLFLTGCERFFIEFYRINPRYEVMGLTLSQAQFIAIIFMFIGVIIIYLRKGRHYAR